MQECIHQARVVTQVRCNLPVCIKVMRLWQYIDCALNDTYARNVLLETKPAEHLLQHIDADARKVAVEHYTYDAVRL